MQLLNDQTKSANQHSLKSERKSERMKSMKKLISIILAVAVIFALNITAFAGGFITDESAMSTGAKADPPYAAAADDNAILKENKAYELYANSTRTIYSVSVTPVRQIVGYYCGPASSYILLKTLGINVQSTTRYLYFFCADESDSNCPYPYVDHTHYKSYTSPQITLADSMGTNYNGTGMSSMKTVINNRQSIHDYSLTRVPSNINQANSLKTKLMSTFDANSPCILWVEARILNEYSGHDFGGHYILANSLNTTSNTIGIVDPNYYTHISTTYTESVNTVLNAIWDNGYGGNIIWCSD